MPPKYEERRNEAQSCESVEEVELIRGFLTEPIQLQMSPPEPRATSSKSTSCQAISVAPSWELKNIDYWNNTNGNMWVGPPIGRGLNLDVVNKVSGDVVQCRVYFSTNPYEAPETRRGQCWRDVYASWQEPAGTGQIWTEFTFDEVGHNIVLHQTWFCEGLETMGT